MFEPPMHFRFRTGAATMTHGLPDLLLIERARSADARAIEALMRRYNQRLYRVARSVLADDQAAEGAVLEAYVAAFGHLERYESTGKFGAWLTRAVLEQARQRSGVTAPAPAADRRNALEAAIDSLPPVFRTVFVLRVVEGISGTEAATALGLNGTTVRTRLYRAHRRLAPGAGLGLAPSAFELDQVRGERIVNGALARLAERAREA
ncbi:MAG TPA: sigma factor-like helix-turn-helix DNA-binding protein [Steroidobacteraceae bacterium]|nr:sigma factor-like helix-turn-helix DNA-binding protein [Steroidobacteraceae bacterium]